MTHDLQALLNQNAGQLPPQPGVAPQAPPQPGVAPQPTQAQAAALQQLLDNPPPGVDMDVVREAMASIPGAAPQAALPQAPPQQPQQQLAVAPQAAPPQAQQPIVVQPVVTPLPTGGQPIVTPPTTEAAPPKRNRGRPKKKDDAILKLMCACATGNVPAVEVKKYITLYRHYLAEE